MATQVKHRRGTNAEIMAGTPAIGELWFNTTDSSVHMGDGATQGGVKHVNVRMTDIVFKNDQYGTAVENMIAGRIEGSITINHVAGNVYSTGGTAWKHKGTNIGTETISDFEFLNDIEPVDFGADPTGVENSSNSLQDAWDVGDLNLSDKYLISSELTSSRDGQKLSGGELIAATQQMTMVNATHDKVVIDGVVFSGDTKARIAIASTGADCVFKYNFIKDLYSTEFGTQGISINTDKEVTVVKNRFQDLDAFDDGIIGNSNGAVRAVYVTYNGDRTGWAIIKDNVISNILGQEGDAIQIQCTPGSPPYASGKARIEGNQIEKCTRRGIKLQASDCEAVSNVYLHGLTNAQSPIFQAAIESVGAENILIQDNTLDGIGGIGIISGGFNLDKFFIKGNTVSSGYASSSDPGWNKSSQRCIFVSDSSDVHIHGNDVTGGVSNIELDGVSFSSVKANTCQGGQGGGGVRIRDCESLYISENYGTNQSTNHLYFIYVDVLNKGVVRDNVALYPDTATYACARFGAGSTKIVAVGNVSDCDNFATLSGSSNVDYKFNNVNLGSGGTGNGLPSGSFTVAAGDTLNLAEGLVSSYTQ